MIGLGTIVNVGTVLIGTTIGILLKNGLPKRFEKTVMQGLGLSTCFIGIGGTLSEVLTIQDGEIGTQHTMLRCHRRSAEYRAATGGFRCILSITLCCQRGQPIC